MPLALPKQRGLQDQSTFASTTLASDSVAHTEPATPTQVIASTDFDTDWVHIWFHTNNGTNTDSDSLVNIKVGAASSETTIIPNLLAGWVANVTSAGIRHYAFPLFIPSGTRISATHRSVRTATNVTINMQLLGGGRGSHWTGTGVEAIGADTATSSGTYLTPGGSSAEGTLADIGSALGKEWGYVQPMLGGNTDTSMLAGVVVVDLGVGSTVLSGLEDFPFYTNASEFSWNGSEGRFCKIPAATQLQLRASTSASAENMAFCVYGVF